MANSAINRMFSVNSLENATENALKKWFPTYLREFEKQNGMTKGFFPTPKNYKTRNSLDADAGELLPAIYIVSPGIIGEPVKRGMGKYCASWRLGIGIGDAAKTERKADTLVKGYCAVAREIILENSGFQGLGVTTIEWTDETYVDLPIPNQLQQYKAGSLFFVVNVDNVATLKPGPATPDQPDYTLGEVEKVFVDVKKVPVTDPVT